MNKEIDKVKNINWYWFTGFSVLALVYFFQAFEIFKSGSSGNLTIIEVLTKGIASVGLAFLFSMQDYFKKGKAKIFKWVFCVLIGVALIAQIIYKITA